MIDETGGVNDRLPFGAAESAGTLGTVRLDPDLRCGFVVQATQTRMSSSLAELRASSKSAPRHKRAP